MSRDKTLLVRLTEDEHTKLTRLAAASGQSISNYVRGELLGSEPAVTRGTPVIVPRAAYAALVGRVENLNTAVQFLANGALDEAKTILSGEEP